MSAAEGEVQEKRYQASFPSLINVDEQPTYVMVLKDASGIVKLYAMVNVQQYNIVTTATTLDECFAQYRALIGTGDGKDLPNDDKNKEVDKDKPAANDKEPEGDAIEATFAIASIQYVDIAGDTYVYLEGSDGNVYRQKFADNENLIFFRNGDNVKAKAVAKSGKTFQIKSIEKQTNS